MHNWPCCGVCVFLGKRFSMKSRNGREENRNGRMVAKFRYFMKKRDKENFEKS